MLDLFRHWDTVTAPHAYARTTATRIYLRIRKNAKRERDAIRRSQTRHQTHSVFDGDVEYVMDLLTRLPIEQREIMAWTIDGYEPSEIAELTGRTAATVRSHLRHARRKLAQMLSQRNPEPTRKEDGDG
jgi:DNA-directed RNA polymerase specialized sigma24 family protein